MGVKWGEAGVGCWGTYLIELKAHQCLDERTLAAGLVAHHDHCGGIEGLVKVLWIEQTSLFFH